MEEEKLPINEILEAIGEEDFLEEESQAGQEAPPSTLTPFQREIANYPVLALAYIGDAVYELFVRRYLLTGGERKPRRLHKRAIDYVSAKSQSDLAAQLEPFLSEEEAWLMRRGRNAHSAHLPPNARVIDYRRATGLEALIGYLHLTEQSGRLEEIFAVLFTGKGGKEGQ